MTFPLQFSVLQIILISITFLSAIYLTTIFRHYILRVVRLRKLSDSESFSKGGLQPVSVVIYTRDNSEQLQSLLNSVFSQNFPSEFEVIVVNDGSSEDTRDVVKAFSQFHRNLKITFIPPQAHNLSRRKLAITLGVKAASFNNLIFTNADAVIESDRWLAALATGFGDGAEVVIGHASCQAGLDDGLTGCMRRFDSLVDAVTYLSGAIGSHPYRANNYNMGFTKKAFLDNKGFSRSLNLHNGDDDIFISEIANSENTSVVLSECSIVRQDLFNPKKIHRMNKKGHIFTGKYSRRRSPLMMSSGSWCWWLWLLSSCAVVWESWFNPVIVAVIGVIAIALWCIMSITWIKISHVLCENIYGFLVPVLSLYRPVYNFFYRIGTYYRKERNYTWV